MSLRVLLAHKTLSNGLQLNPIVRFLTKSSKSKRGSLSKSRKRTFSHPNNPTSSSFSGSTYPALSTEYSPQFSTPEVKSPPQSLHFEPSRETPLESPRETRPEIPEPHDSSPLPEGFPKSPSLTFQVPSPSAMSKSEDTIISPRRRHTMGRSSKVPKRKNSLKRILRPLQQQQTHDHEQQQQQLGESVPPRNDCAEKLSPPLFSQQGNRFFTSPKSKADRKKAPTISEKAPSSPPHNSQGSGFAKKQKKKRPPSATDAIPLRKSGGGGGSTGGGIPQKFRARLSTGPSTRSTPLLPTELAQVKYCCLSTITQYQWVDFWFPTTCGIGTVHVSLCFRSFEFEEKGEEQKKSFSEFNRYGFPKPEVPDYCAWKQNLISEENRLIEKWNTSQKLGHLQPAPTPIQGAFSSGLSGAATVVTTGGAVTSSPSTIALLKNLVRKGVPPVARPRLWRFCAGSKRFSEIKGYYNLQLIKSEMEFGVAKTLAQIEIDLPRTFSNQPLFQNLKGLLSLRRVLIAFSMHNKSIGYCQSMNFVCGVLLIFLDEQDAFWVLVYLIEQLVPTNYSSDILGVRVDKNVAIALATEKLPKLMSHVALLQFPLEDFISKWLLQLFVNILPIETVLRVLDVFLLEGSKVLLRVVLAILKLNEQVYSIIDSILLPSFLSIIIPPLPLFFFFLKNEN